MLNVGELTSNPTRPSPRPVSDLHDDNEVGRFSGAICAHAGDLEYVQQRVGADRTTHTNLYQQEWPQRVVRAFAAAWSERQLG